MNSLSVHSDEKPERQGDAPLFDLQPGMIAALGRAGSRLLMKVERRIGKHGSTPSRLQFLDLQTAQPVFMDDRDLAYLMRTGEFELVFDAEGRSIPQVPFIDINDAKSAYVVRRREYVDGCLALGNPPPRSRAVLQRVIAEVGEKRGESETQRPGFTTVLNWIDRAQALRSTKGDACFANQVNPGNRRPRVVKGAVSRAVAHVIGTMAGNKTAEDARNLIKGYLQVKHPEIPPTAVPSLRTVQRRLSGRNRFGADALRFGPKTAERKHRGRYEQPRPELPLMEVECDHTPLDIILCDESRDVIFGRADAITFRDRCTGMCLGLSIGFGPPSFASFLNGLRHAIYPKDISGYPTIQNPWLGFGRFKRLYVDNALHFIGHDIRNAGNQLGYELVEFRPGNPWLKGGEEKLQGDLNRATSHKLPGSTFANVQERKRYEEEAEMPVLTVRELRAYLTYYICEVYHTAPHEGLGFLSTLPDIPNRLWKEKIDKVKLVELPSDDLFLSMAGQVDQRSINTKGIRWDYIRYQSDALDTLRTHPDHRNGREEDGRAGRRYDGTMYKVMRDPFDLGSIWVHNHHDKGSAPIRVPACRGDYANGLTLHQHQVFIRNTQTKVLRSLQDPIDELGRAKQQVTEYAVALMANRRQQGIQKLLARFLEAGQRHHQRAQTSTPSTSAALSNSPLDPRAPIGFPPSAPINPNSPQLTPTRRPKVGTEAEPMITGQGIPVPEDRGASRAAPDPAGVEDEAGYELEAMRRRKREEKDKDLESPGDDRSSAQSPASSNLDDPAYWSAEAIRERKRKDGSRDA